MWSRTGFQIGNRWNCQFSWQKGQPGPSSGDTIQRALGWRCEAQHLGLCYTVLPAHLEVSDCQWKMPVPLQGSTSCPHSKGIPWSRPSEHPMLTWPPATWLTSTGSLSATRHPPSCMTYTWDSQGESPGKKWCPQPPVYPPLWWRAELEPVMRTGVLELLPVSFSWGKWGNAWL